MKNIKFLADKSEASVTWTSSCSKDAITSIRGFGEIKFHTVDVSVWKEWRFKIETLVASAKPISSV